MIKVAMAEVSVPFPVFAGTEPLGRLRWTGLALGFAGVGVLAAPELGGDVLSIAEIVIAAACYAGGSIVAAPRKRMAVNVLREHR